MHFETSRNEELPAVQAKKVSPQERLSERNMVQVDLMGRDPAGEEDWIVRYSPTFGSMFDTNEDGFYDQVREAHMETDAGKKSGMLTKIQERLDAKLSGSSH